jgi:hypothetical protein
VGNNSDNEKPQQEGASSEKPISKFKIPKDAPVMKLEAKRVKRFK